MIGIIIPMDEIVLESIEWQAPEYNHKKKTPDFLWTIGLIAFAVAVVSLWFGNIVFAIFVILAGASLIMFTVREPGQMNFSIKTEGLGVGKEKYEWKNIKGFNIIKGEVYGKLLIETSKYFLPVYAIPFPISMEEQIKTELSKVIQKIEIKESASMAFAEKIGF